MYGQLQGCRSLRDVARLLKAHQSMLYHLGLGNDTISLGYLSKLNMSRDYHIFEDFAYAMVKYAQKERVDYHFEMDGKFYAFDSTTIDLCLKCFPWAKFRSTKAGVKVHTQFDIVTQIPTAFYITPANVHDVNVMDWIDYEPGAFYIIDKGYYDLARLYAITLCNSYFVIREKGRPKYDIVDGDKLLEGDDNILLDQMIDFQMKQTKDKYPIDVRRIVYYSPEQGRTFTFYTNNTLLEGADIALLYKNRWQVETFFKWLKQYLKIKSFWGNNENAVRIQIYTAICTYCLMAVIEHRLHLQRPIYEAIQVLSASLLDKTPLSEFFFPSNKEDSSVLDPNQLNLFC